MQLSDAASALSLFDLSGKRALITGASQGIGLALARGLAGAGARVVINGRSQQRLDHAAAGLNAEGLAIETACFDVTQRAEVDAGIDALLATGPLDILINNAGIQRRNTLEAYSDEDWQDILQANLTSVFYVARKVGQHMVARRRGKIINIGSVQSELGRRSIAPYAATKGAVKMFTKGMCADWAQYGIQINTLAPGYFKTEMNRSLVENEEFSAWLCQRTPAGRWGDVEELCGTAIFLASQASSFVNGQIIYVDGGLTSSV